MKKIYKLIQNNDFVLICPNVPFDAGYESKFNFFFNESVVDRNNSICIKAFLTKL